MKIASVADIKARLSAYLKETATGPVVHGGRVRPASSPHLRPPFTLQTLRDFSLRCSGLR